MLFNGEGEAFNVCPPAEYVEWRDCLADARVDRSANSLNQYRPSPGHRWVSDYV